MIKNKGFTLSEVLITLGVIGVISAMTLPAVILNYQKQSTALKVKKFYNLMNNAVNMSATENGDVNSWFPERKDNTYDENLEFLQKYILPYIKFIKYYKCQINATTVCVNLPDGTLFEWHTDVAGTDIVLRLDDITINKNYQRNRFKFQFNKRSELSKTTFIEPYIFNWDGNYESLKTHKQYGCRKGVSYFFCTKLLQLNNWEFPKDYPW